MFSPNSHVFTYFSYFITEFYASVLVSFFWDMSLYNTLHARLCMFLVGVMYKGEELEVSARIVSFDIACSILL